MVESWNQRSSQRKWARIQKEEQTTKGMAKWVAFWKMGCNQLRLLSDSYGYWAGMDNDSGIVSSESVSSQTSVLIALPIAAFPGMV